MPVTNWDEQQRRDVAGTFSSPGWQVLKAELLMRKEIFIQGFYRSADRTKDDQRRASIEAIDQLLKLERDLFTPPNPQQEAFTIPTLPSVNRYD
jgi:hypothetical protein